MTTKVNTSTPSYIARKARVTAIIARTAAARAAIDAFIVLPDTEPVPEELVITMPAISPEILLPQTVVGHQPAYHVEQRISTKAQREAALAKYRPLADVVGAHIRGVLIELDGNISLTAIALRVHRTTLHRMLKDKRKGPDVRLGGKASPNK